MRYLLLLAVSLGMPTLAFSAESICSRSDILLCEDFEWSGNSSFVATSADWAAHGWGVNIFNAGTVYCGGVGANGSSCAFRDTITAGAANNAGQNADFTYADLGLTVSDLTTLYLRMYVKYDAGFVFNDGQMKIAYLRAIRPSDGGMAWRVELANYGTGGPTADLFVDLNIHYLHLNANVGNGTLQSGRWYAVELMVTPNTVGQSNGAAKVWLDGTLIIDYAGLDMRQVPPAQGPADTPLNDFLIGSYYGGPTGTHPTESLTYDNLVLSKSPIGLVGASASADTQAPSLPAGLSAQAASSSQINLAWSAATDNIGVTGYRIFRSGTQIATAAGTSYSDTGLSASTAYTYTVAAYDAAGNVSAQSSAASATTPAPAGTPGTVTDLSAAASGATGVNLSFTQVSDGTGQPAKYAVRYSSSGQLWGGAPDVAQGTCTSPFQGTAVTGSLSCSALGLTAATQYQFQLVSYRGTLNQGATFGGLSNVATASTGAAGATCDVNNDGTANVVDVQLSVNQALGAASCNADINRDGMCNVVDVQRIVNAALGGACAVGP